jgi:hypothetical protein
MIFICQEDKAANAGDFCEFFFKKFEEIKEINPDENIGWKIIDSIPLNCKQHFTKLDDEKIKELYRPIRFLN